MQILKSQDLWDIVISGPQSSDKTAEREAPKFSKEEKMRDALALHLIQQGVAITIYPKILGSKTAHEAWSRLESEYKGSKKVIKIKLTTLRRQLDDIKMKEGETTQEYFAKVTEEIFEKESEIRMIGANNIISLKCIFEKESEIRMIGAIIS